MSNMTLNTKVYAGTTAILNGVSHWVECSLGIAALFSRVRSSLRVADLVRIKVDLDLPYPQPEGAPVCCGPDEVRLATFVGSIRLHPSLTTAERTDFRLRLKDLFASAQITALIDNLDQQV